MSREVVLKPIDATPEQIAEAIFRFRPIPKEMGLVSDKKNLNTSDSRNATNPRV